MRVIDELEEQAEKVINEYNKKVIQQREEDKKRKCQECGSSPASIHIYNGMYKTLHFPTEKKFTFCASCKEKFDKWYYPNEM